jgi:hypothetical protein
MTTVPYLWINIIFANVTIAAFVLLGASAAMKSAGMPKERIRRNAVKGGIILFGWMAADIFLGWLGVFRSSPAYKIPYIAFGIAIPISVGIWLIQKSATIREILRAVPQQKIVGIQLYRGLGSIFLILLGLRLLPGAFAVPAGFGDVFVGFTAMLVAGAYMSGMAGRNSLVAVWNVLGILDLVIAVTAGFLSAPGPFQRISFAQPNILVGTYPLVMIPVFAVPLSIVLHAGSLAKLRWSTQTNQAKAA